MKIKRLTIKNFGGIHQETMEFLPGINVLYGSNESGKTTVYTFIKSMFYGLRRMRGKAARNDEYSVYEPWEDPSVYGGTIWFEDGGRNFRLSRSFVRGNPVSEFLCEDDGEVLDVEQGDLDGVLGGVSEIVYENTVAVGQLKNVTGPELVSELQNYMANYQGAADNSVDLGRAMQMLKMNRKGFQVQAERKKKELAAHGEKVLSHMDFLRGELEDLKEKRRALQEEKENSSKKETEAASIDEEMEMLSGKIRSLSMGMVVTVALMLLAAVLLGIFLTEGILPLVAVLVIGFTLLTAEFVLRQNAEKEYAEQVNLREKWTQKQEKLHQKQEKLQWNMEHLREAYHEKKMHLRNLQSEYEECEAALNESSEEEKEIKALNLAMETIEKLSGGIHNRVGNELKEKTSRIFSELTGGKYGEVLMDEDLHMSVNTQERIVPLERLSRGTVEQLYFAFRMAAGEILCGEEVLPVILDDMFGMYDEERLCAALRWLSKGNRQVIIGSCHKREMELLEREGIAYHQILL